MLISCIKLDHALTTVLHMFIGITSSVFINPYPKLYYLYSTHAHTLTMTSCDTAFGPSEESWNTEHGKLSTHQLRGTRQIQATPTSRCLVRRATS